jgi:catechol 2,3-dioxygenase-like lactoylglutathione lyase family enzyme
MSSPVQIQAIDHVVIRVERLDPMLHFYCDVLGCTLERRRDDIGLIQLRAGDALIDLVPVDGKLGSAGGAAPREGGRNMDHFCLRIANFDAVALKRWFARHDVDMEEPAMRYGAEGNGPSVYLRDPEGNVVELKATTG